jgi:hypothetical protein
MSSSTLEVVGKANSKRVGRSGSREAGATQASKRRIAFFPKFRRAGALILALAVTIAIEFHGNGSNLMQITMIRISAVAMVSAKHPQASLQVALHVTKRQNGAKASNRVCVSGGISGRDDSQETLSKAAADGSYICWLEGSNASGVPKYAY